MGGVVAVVIMWVALQQRTRDEVEPTVVETTTLAVEGTSNAMYDAAAVAEYWYSVPAEGAYETPVAMYAVPDAAAVNLDPTYSES